MSRTVTIRRWRASFWAVIALGWGTLTGQLVAQVLRVPAGFEVELVAGPPLVQHPTMAGFDDQGRLYVCDGPGMNLPAKELLRDLPNLIRRLEDTDGDGKFDQSVVYADKMTFPMGAVWYQGSVYTASPPQIWKLTDRDGDGVADDRQVLVSEFGFTGNAADIHGCFLHPDGRLFWCDGRHGHNFVDENGNQISKGLAARLFNCRLDGKQVEAFAGGGMDNPVEVTFTDEGEPLGTVAIFDVVEGRHDALIHWVYGGAYPRYEQKCVDEFKRTGELLGSVSRWSGVAPSGVARYRGTALGKGYSGSVFSAQFNTHTIVRSTLERHGATYRAKDEDFLTSTSQDFHPTDVLEDADGSLLVIDTGGWFRIGCPTSQIAKPEILGGIYRIRRTGAPRVDDPRGLKLAWNNVSAAALVERLNDARPAVRERAMSALHALGKPAVATLAAKVKEEGDVSARRDALWTLGRIGGDEALAAIRAALDLRPAPLKQVAAQLAGTARDRAAVDRLCELVIEEGPTVRREAATALGRIGALGHVEDRHMVASLLASAASVDERFLEHSVIYALIQANDTARLLAALDATNPLTARAALLALDQLDPAALPRERVTKLLAATNAPLQQAALDVIAKRGWAAETFPLLTAWLAEPQPSAERLQVIERTLRAFVADNSAQQLIGQALNRTSTAVDTRLLLLELITNSGLKQLPESWRSAVTTQLVDSDPRIVRQAIASTAALGSTTWQTELRTVAGDARQPATTRAAALNVLTKQGATLTDAEFALLSAQLAEQVPPVDRIGAAEALANATLSASQQPRLVEQIATAGPLELPLLLRAFEKKDIGAEVIARLIDALGRSPGLDNLAPERIAKLVSNASTDVQPAAQALIKRLSADAEARRAQLHQLAGELTGGDAKRGRSVFNDSKYLCASCHRVQGQGSLIGPDLTTVGKIRSHLDLIESVIFPSASFVRGYESYTVVTTAGIVQTGVIARETADAIYVRNAQRLEVRIARAEIDQLEPAKISIMPQGLDKLLPPRDLKDLIAYLESLK